MARRGFTLLEIMLTVGVLMIIAGLGYVFSFQYVRVQHLREDAQLATAELSVARAQANAQVDAASHGVKFFPDRVVRFTGASYAARVVGKDVVTTFPIVSAVSGDNEILFPQAGIVPDAASTATLTLDTHAFDITVSTYGLIDITERTIGG